MATQIIYIAGDVHGFWHLLNGYIDGFIRNNEGFKSLISEHEKNLKDVEVIILQCGDFGLWEESELTNLPLDTEIDFIKDGHVKIYFADGNHENHDLLDKLEAENPSKQFIEVSPYVYFATFGSILNLIDGTNVMFCGGAESSDRDERVEGEDWWAQEGIDENDMLRLPSSDTKVDWIVSHAAPSNFHIKVRFGYSGVKKLKQASREQLDIILKKYKPKQWYFGHYHLRRDGKTDDCAWNGFAHSTNYEIEYWISLEKIIKV